MLFVVRKLPRRSPVIPVVPESVEPPFEDEFWDEDVAIETVDGRGGPTRMSCWFLVTGLVHPRYK